MNIEARTDQYLELEKIALGAFAPLTGFMKEDDFESVVDTMRLSTGELFPLPVIFDVAENAAAAIKVGDSVGVTYRGRAVGEILVESIYRCDKAAVALKVFGTNDADHPGVAHFFQIGDVFVGGKVRMLNRVSFEFSAFELTPAKTRELFARSGFKTVAGFQTRNVPHRAHEYLQRLALEVTDGLFIQPLVGRKKAGDYTPEAILAAYQTMVNDFYPKDRAVLGILSTAMRYAGPREALFHALIRRNYGCTHFVIGRDHAGVGGYYGKYQAQNLALKHEEELGIKILAFPGPFYCKACDGIATEKTCRHVQSDQSSVMHISGTQVRRMLLSQDNAHKEWMRPEILESVRGLKLFVEKDEEPRLQQ